MKHQLYKPNWFYIPDGIWRDTIGNGWKDMFPLLLPGPCGPVRTPTAHAQSPLLPLKSFCLVSTAWPGQDLSSLLREIYIRNHQLKVLGKVQQCWACPRINDNTLLRDDQLVRNIGNSKVNRRLKPLHRKAGGCYGCCCCCCKRVASLRNLDALFREGEKW